MAISEGLQGFLEQARSQGATDDLIVSLLRGRGWPQADVDRVLADEYEMRTGLAIPGYRRSGSAKDAFLYLLSFSTLAIWAEGLGSVLFTLIDRYLKDPVSNANTYVNYSYAMASSLACLIIAFPVYLLTMRSILGSVEIYPEKLDSGVRKWLTYLALLITAGILLGDLICFLTYFLRGELTGRFVAKVLTALVIAGGIFWYYFGALATSKRRLESVHVQE
jgi:hypothetical protein